MMRLKIVLLLFCPFLIVANVWGAPPFSPDDISFKKVEVPFYVFAEYTPQVALRMEYAGYEIADPEVWRDLAKDNVPYEIDLVFTKYPEDVNRWRTNYDELLQNRLRELIGIDSVFLNKNIRWNMYLQTKCKTETEAKEYFHGFVVKYRPRKLRVVEDISSVDELRDMISGNVVPQDSTVIKVMERHPEWDNMLVVMDWTGSMYQYGAQLVLWHRLQLAGLAGRTRHMVFFNDGNQKKTWQKAIGKTGGIYYTRTEDILEIVETMEKVLSRGNGGDVPENDLEALIKGITLLDGFDEVVLIADNKSDIRDIQLLDHITRPIHVILCDVREDNYINTDYVKLAYKTGGSLHTIERDLAHLAELQQGERITIGNLDYMVRDGELSQVVRMSP